MAIKLLYSIILYMKNLSIIISNYNLINHLKIVSNRVRELDSECELILADDCSDDGSIEWAKQSNLFNNIHYENTRKLFRVSTIRNKGIKLSTKDNILLLDSSCYLGNNTIKAHFFILNNLSDSVSQGVVHFMEQDCVPEIKDEIFNVKLFEKINHAFRVALTSNLFFPKKYWEEIGGFDEDFNGAWGYEDSDFIIRLEKINKNIYKHFQSDVFHMNHERKCLEAWENRQKNLDLLYKKHDLKKIVEKFILDDSIKIYKNGKKDFTSCVLEAKEKFFIKLE